MKIKGLFIKLYGLIQVPTIAFVILAGIGVFNSYDSYSSNKFVAGNIPVVRASINLFTKLQIERGMSIAYVNGAKNFSKIEAHRKKVDSDFNLLLSEIKGDSIDISSSLSLVREALALREKIKIVSKVAGFVNPKIMTIEQKMIGTDGVIKNEMTMHAGLFDLKQRKLLPPSDDWMQAIGVTGDWREEFEIK